MFHGCLSKLNQEQIDFQWEAVHTEPTTGGTADTHTWFYVSRSEIQ